MSCGLPVDQLTKTTAMHHTTMIRNC